MEFLRLAALILAECVLGLALVALAPAGVLRRTLRLEKMGAALLMGAAGFPYIILLGLLAGGRLAGWWLVALGIGGALLLLARSKRWKDLWLNPDDLSAAPGRAFPLPLPAPIRLYALIALAALVSWVVLAGAFLPPSDYDSFSLWSYRVRVLLAERHFYAEALLDPLRFIPARQHPYLLPVMETLPALAFGRFSFSALQMAHLLIYGGFLLLALAAVRREQRGGRPARAMTMLAALVLMPAASVHFTQESMREVLIGFYALGAVYFLARWAESPRWFYILAAAGLGIVTQQIKVEGVPLVLGLTLGAGLLVIMEKRRLQVRRMRQWFWSVAFALAIAAPYGYVLHNRMPDPTFHGYDFTADLNVTLQEQVRAAAVVAWLTLAEFFARPELYGLTLYAVAGGLIFGWRRKNAAARLALLAAPAACVAAVMLIYVGRNARLPPERNVTYSRRMMCALPALTFAAIALPSRRRRVGERRREMDTGKPQTIDHDCRRAK